MPNGSFDNGPNLDTASQIALMKQRYEVADEAVFLAQQAADAKLAIQRTLTAMQETAKSAADVRAWTQQYPWYAVGIAAAAGFLTATTVRPTSQPQRHGIPAQTTSASDTSLWSSARSLLWGIGRSLLMRTIAGAVEAGMDGAEKEETK